MYTYIYIYILAWAVIDKWCLRVQSSHEHTSIHLSTWICYIYVFVHVYIRKIHVASFIVTIRIIRCLLFWVPHDSQASHWVWNTSSHVLSTSARALAGCLGARCFRRVGPLLQRSAHCEHHILYFIMLCIGCYFVFCVVPVIYFSVVAACVIEVPVTTFDTWLRQCWH